MKFLNNMIKRLIFQNIVEINLKSKTIEIDIGGVDDGGDSNPKDLFEQNYAGTYKSALRKVCQQNGIKVISPRQMCEDLNIKFALLKERETLQICFPETMKGVGHMYRMRVAKEIRKYTPQIMKILKVGQS
jgi:hypothetical protein